MRPTYDLAGRYPGRIEEGPARRGTGQEGLDAIFA